MASYRGSAIFGRAVRMKTADNPRAEQKNGFFGLSGIETLDGGLRGRTTVAQGVFTAYDYGTIAAAMESFRSFNDGLAGTLVDTRNVSWLNVKLASFEPGDRIGFDPTYGYYATYQATFQHLT
jgi:hypothetical protein